MRQRAARSFLYFPYLLLLQPSCLLIAEVATVCKDDMIHEVDAHELTSPLDLNSKIIVVRARA